ncbi:MAG: UDP-N-acetylmuramoyl-tripeptide--D-alanyl-D-alanine ligase [Candidatus Marinimicrobia bacterium]|nr:UDP-N-acetylmuramoyl-tripeptide--D-alanyl-D-alanine ligase [Candidatus Neomarinimicrobiota bacterium]
MAIQHNTIMSLPDISIKGQLSAPVTGVSIDTRTLNAGDLFVAFSGAQVDGHDFIPKAISRGASAVMASTVWDGCESWNESVPLIITEDPVKSLADLSRMHRNRFNIPIIAITGTNGKTTTKNLLSHFLGTKYSVLSTIGNLNNHIGLPLTLLSLNETHDFAVIEMGASQKGDIKYLCEIAHPNQGLITNISMAHTEFFHNIDTIQHTKGELFSYLREHDGQIFANLDDLRVKQLAESLNTAISFGFHTGPGVVFDLIEPDEQGFYSLRFNNNLIHLPQVGKAFALNAAAAMTMAMHNGVSQEEIEKSLDTYRGEAGRMQFLPVNNIHFYNDAYNANPASTRSGIETIQAMVATGRKILIFADMLELGDQSRDFHLRIADLILNAKFDFVFLFGLEVMVIAQKFEDAGYSTFYHNVDKAATIQHFLRQVAAGDLVYLKGSRSMKLEDFITAYKERN